MGRREHLVEAKEDQDMIDYYIREERVINFFLKKKHLKPPPPKTTGKVVVTLG